MKRPTKASLPYRVPSAVGGTIIRKVIKNFKDHGFALPITSPTFIATSGGVDSMALAHLIAKYGRRVVVPAQITLLHFDHQWRKESGTIEKRAVRRLASDLGVKFLSVKLDPPAQGKRLNWEEDARRKRNEFYFSQKKANFVFTAHHQDDVAETLFWRFLRGEFDQNRSGILFQDDKVLRPFLQVTKNELYAYAQAEEVPFFEDPTNGETSQMRSFLRKKLFPLVEQQFPALKRTLARYAAGDSRGGLASDFARDSARQVEEYAASDFQGKVEVVTHAVEQLTSRLNRSQKNEIAAAIQSGIKLTKEQGPRRITLPGGVVLTSESKGKATRFLIEILDP